MAKRTWGEWGDHVLKALEENGDEHKQIMDKLHELELTISKWRGTCEKELSVLKVKSGIIGALAGAIPALAYWLLKK